MKYSEIENYVKVNETCPAHVDEIKESILKNGWTGMPILVSEVYGRLITGSHRLTAIQSICDDDWDYVPDNLGDIAECVDDIIDDFSTQHDVTFDELPFDDLRLLFAGTWVEKFKDELKEW